MNRSHSSESFVNRTAATISRRRSDYAHPQDNHQLTADLVQAWIHHSSRAMEQGRRPRYVTAEDVCIFNILQKLSRLAHGTHDDSLLDIVGYVENISMLRCDQRNVPPPE